MNDTTDLNSANWRKSSYSDGGDGNCVEVAGGFTDVVPVRDSKRPQAATLLVPAASWSSFLTALRDEDLGTV